MIVIVDNLFMLLQGVTLIKLVHIFVNVCAILQTTPHTDS